MGYNQILEKVKSLRQKFSNAVISGTGSGRGSMVWKHFHLFKQIYVGVMSVVRIPEDTDATCVRCSVYSFRQPGTNQSDAHEVNNESTDKILKKKKLICLKKKIMNGCC